MSAFGPFAIQRVESGRAADEPIAPVSVADAPVASVLKRAAEVYADRAAGRLERSSPAVAETAEMLRVRSSAIGAAALEPLLASLSSSNVLAALPRAHDALAPVPSVTAVWTSVFHVLSNMKGAPLPQQMGKDTSTPAAAPAHATEHAADNLGPLLDEFIPKRT